MATRPPKPTPAQASTPPSPCEGYAVEGRSNEVEDRVGNYFGLPKDLGPVDGGTGDVILNAEGEPAAYVVAEGDTTYAIAERFCFGTAAYLEEINSIRRNGAWAPMSDEDGTFVIFPGDTLNLDPYTIASVGDEQGVVYDHTPDFHIPPQR
ncbi:LysM domain-containing protein [Microbacterium oryzae]|uniref:LysM peptidoglycan-binding domain-containing protein n=1 Tax=Microbacterium oryzae TaxID=743009 RepID=UPI0025B1C76F|nr:LysM domain-containing protein [Microbacterium oryzae]MDN3309315.1 LysM domain-containing protein [Microbacterium oryzae]